MNVWRFLPKRTWLLQCDYGDKRSWSWDAWTLDGGSVLLVIGVSWTVELLTWQMAAVMDAEGGAF
jgi:hypothetical protein